MNYNQYNHNGQNYQNPYSRQQPSHSQSRSSFSIASMVCGIISIFLCCIGLSFPFGALGILFAVLTYRKGWMLDSMSMIGLVTSCMGFLFSILLIVSTLVQLPEMLKDPDFRNSMDILYEEFYGQDFAEFWENNYGIELE